MQLHAPIKSAMKILKHLPLLTLVCLVPYMQASGWSIASEISYANLSGVRAFEASKNFNRNESKDLLAPSMAVTKSIGDKSRLSLRYTFFDSIGGSGVSSNSDIFGEGEFSAPALTPYRFEEKMHEFTFSYLRQVADFGIFSMKLGPNLSLYDSSANFFGRSPSDRLDHYLRTSSSTDFAIGVEMSTNLKLTEKLHAAIIYRFSNPPDRNVHLAMLAFKFNL